jgi:hypothetical protein
MWHQTAEKAVFLLRGTSIFLPMWKTGAAVILKVQLI